MASPALKVFAVPELFDQIIMNDCVSAAHLYIIQRVSQHFKSATALLFYLQGKMQLRQLTEQESQEREGHERSLLAIPSFSCDNSIEYRPFIMRGIHFDSNVLHLDMVLSTDMADFAHECGTIFGLKGRKSIHGVAG